jgi:hypothetical protein
VSFCTPTYLSIFLHVIRILCDSFLIIHNQHHMIVISDPILNTLEKVVTVCDGISELVNEKTLQVVLPKKVATTLGVKEETIFSTVIDTPNSQFVSYHSDLLNKFLEILAGVGTVAALGVKYESYLKTSGFEKIIQKIVPHNGLIRYVDAKPQTTRYIFCNVAYVAEADEKRIGMVSFVINEFTGVTPVAIGDALLWESDFIPIDDNSLPQTMLSSELSKLIEKTSANLVEKDLEKWSAKLRRARERDEDRLKSYYGTISAEITNKITSKGLDGENKEKELARIEATNRELERKLADITERYALKVSAELYSAIVLHLPTIHITCSLQRKKAKRDINIVWNPFTKVLEPIRCEVSGEPIYDFYLDDKDAKIVSAKFWEGKV